MKQKLRCLYVACIAGASLNFSAQTVDISSVDYFGPIPVSKPWISDSTDVNNKTFDVQGLLSRSWNKPNLSPRHFVDSIVLGGKEEGLHLISIPLQNSRYANVTLKVEGSEAYKIFLNGKEHSSEFSLKPGKWDIVVKTYTPAGESDTLKIALESPQSEYITVNSTNSLRPFTIEDVIYSTHVRGVEMSPSGKYAIVTTATTTSNRKAEYETRLLDAKSGTVISYVPHDMEWLPNEDVMWHTETTTDGKLRIVTVNPVGMAREVMASNIPEGDFVISPNGKDLVYTIVSQGPEEDKDIYRVINPEDRQPGWRDRRSLAIYNIEDGILRDLTFGNKNVDLQDISPDGGKILVMKSENRFGKRPTTLFSLYELDRTTLSVDTLVENDGFLNGASYSPDGKKIVIMGSPEALKGVGKNVPEGRIPNMTEGELFILDIETGAVNPITKFFNPSVSNAIWHAKSGKIIFSAEDKDKVSLFCYDPATDKIKNLNVPEDMVDYFVLAQNANNGALITQSADRPEALYLMNLEKATPQYSKIIDTGAGLLDDVMLAKVVEWNFINSVGDTINGRYYLPPGYDPTKKYPLIVNYYGGCSPTSRNFASRYPHHLYANNGYIVYIVNPSGATGFGQEFASRHVNTAGEGVARDIIEGTTKLLEELPSIDAKKIGCIGASYGGFMTQYLQTVTDIFAAAVSHAGISDHTSYWGNGYWGYSYSEVSMADSYPWSDRELYVNQSPLYNADKINTPILFVHGDVDTNVPPGESIQLFTALKLLGKDTELVEVSGQNHHILEPMKRIKWQDTILAWFAKYLQDDPTWWDSMYDRGDI